MTRELDEQVAVEVMGWTRAALRPKRWVTQVRGEVWHHTPNFADSIADAWFVVERMRELGLNFTLDCRSESSDIATFYNDDGTVYEQVAAGTAPLAICQAALAAVRAKEGRARHRRDQP